MTARRFSLSILVAGLIAAGGYGLYRLGVQHALKTNAGAGQLASSVAAATGPQKPGDVDPASGRRVLYWHDPMVPGQKFDKPGKSPFMDMQLVPVYAEGGGNDTGALSIDPRVQQNLGVRTAEVRSGTITMAFEAVGSTAYNERDVAVVQPRTGGFIERLYVRAPLDPVRKGQPLADLYVPDWVVAQEEYLSARRIREQSRDKTMDSLVDAARQRMRLAGMSDAQIARVESDNRVEGRTTLVSPISGVVAELGAREGMTVMAGVTLYRINGLSTIWVNAEVPESRAGLVRPGNFVEARTPALPGEIFKGKVSAILPEVNAATRTIKARVELANPKARLVPGMFATVDFTPAARKDTLLVPTEAVIQTGKRSVVIVADAGGTFTPVEVDVGAESGGQTEIRRGLTAGQRVVVSGQFLIDSEASLKGALARMEGAASTSDGSTTAATNASNPGSAAVVHLGEGKVEAIDKDGITLSHGPIPTLKWNAMTMTFRLPSADLARNIAVGDTVAFEIRARPDGNYEIALLRKAGKSQPRRGNGSVNESAVDREAGPKS